MQRTVQTGRWTWTLGSAMQSPAVASMQSTSLGFGLLDPCDALDKGAQATLAY